VQNQEMDIEIRKRDKDYLMTDFEVAELAKVPVNTIRYWRQTGIMPFVKVGRHPRIWLSTFEKVFQDRWDKKEKKNSPGNDPL
jgi:excisionase family DNA binding protein